MVLDRTRLSLGIPRRARLLWPVEHAHNRAKTDAICLAPTWNAFCGCPVSSRT